MINSLWKLNHSFRKNLRHLLCRSEIYRAMQHTASHKNTCPVFQLHCWKKWCLTECIEYVQQFCRMAIFHSTFQLESSRGRICIKFGTALTVVDVTNVLMIDWGVWILWGQNLSFPFPDWQAQMPLTQVRATYCQVAKLMKNQLSLGCDILLYFTYIKAYCLVIAAMILLGFFWIPLIFFGVFFI